MIDGVKIIPKKQIIDERGKIMHMLRNDDKNFSKFGEIYFSYTHPNTVKAWHLHKRMTVNYVCVVGKIKLVLFDDREDSKSSGKYSEHILTPKNFFLITIPPLIWNGFIGLDKSESIVANCASLPHDEKEMVRRKHDDKYFKYDWKV